MFEQDRTFREAVSDKFKARAMGFKQKFTPLNIIRMLTGSGGIGRSIRTVAGRAMGYSERDIEYFGGYKRKRSIYGPDRSKVPAGSRSPAKMNDSTADILAKIYNLMRKIDADNTRRYEREQEFAEENKLEEENRQNKFLSFFKRKSKKTNQTTSETPEEKPEEDKSGGIMNKIFGSIFGVFGKIFKAFAALGGLFGLITSLIGMAKGILATAVELTMHMLAPLLEGIFKGIVKFLFNVLPRFASTILDVVSKTGDVLADLIDSISGIDPVQKSKMMRMASKIGLASVMGGVFDDNLDMKYNQLYVGKKASDLYKQAEEEKLSVDYKYPEQIFGKNNDNPLFKYRKRELDKIDEKKALADQLASDYRLNLIPNLESMGYELKSYDKNGIPIFKNDKGESPTNGQLIAAAAIEKDDMDLNNFIPKNFLEKLDPRNSETFHKLQDELHDLGMKAFVMSKKMTEIPNLDELNPAEQIKSGLNTIQKKVTKAKTANEQRISIDEVSIRDPLLQGPNGPIRWVYENRK